MMRTTCRVFFLCCYTVNVMLLMSGMRDAGWLFFSSFSIYVQFHCLLLHVCLPLCVRNEAVSLWNMAFCLLD